MRRLVFLVAILLFAYAGRQAAADTAPGGGLPVDLSELRPDEKASFERLVQRYPSACGKAQSLYASVKSDPRCRRSVFAARYIARLLKAHLLESEVEEQYDLRFGPVKKNEFDLKDAPLRGDPNAPVTIVEFSDFQCPHCKRLQPLLERLLDDYRGQVKLYFKNYPITRMHPYAEIAAQAALAAGRQGKFWAFHDKLFAGDQEKESPSDLEKIAKDLKLDVKKWRSDLDAQRSAVERDHAEGERVEINATPTVFINGRQYHGPHIYEDLKDWVDEELNK